MHETIATEYAIRLRPRLRPISVPPLPDIDATLPDLLVALPGGDQARLPRLTWPQAAVEQDARNRTRQRARRSGFAAPPSAPLMSVREATIAEADELLLRWRHPLSLAGRPLASRRFGRLAYVLDVAGDAVAVTASASSPNRSVMAARFGLERKNTVDLARIARRDRAATLAALRLWREYLAPLYADVYTGAGWDRATLRAAITYSLPGTPSSAGDHAGVYRRDGWTRVRRRKTSQPGPGSRQQAPATAAIADGVPGLWVWPYHDDLKRALAAAKGGRDA